MIRLVLAASYSDTVLVKFFMTWHLSDEFILFSVKVTLYAIENNSSLYESGLTEDKEFVSKETLLEAFQEYADGTPSELFQSPEIVDFGVLLG